MRFKLKAGEIRPDGHGKTLLRLLAQTFPRWPFLLGFMLAALAVSTLDNFFTFLNKQIVDQGILTGDRSALAQLVILYSGLILVHTVMVYAHNFLTEYLGHLVRYDLRRKIFSHVHQLPYAYFDQTPVGTLMAHVTSDTEQMAEFVSWGLLNVAWCFTRLGTALYFMVLINWPLALIVFAIVPVLWLTSLWFRRRLIAKYRRVRQLNSHITGAYNETITGVRTIKALGRERENLRGFSKQADEMYQASYQATWLSALFQPSVQLIAALAVGCIAWYGGWQTQQGILTIGGIQAFIAYAWSLLWPMDRLANTYAAMLQNALASAERVFALLDKPVEIVDRPGAIDPGTICGDIEFDHVSFWYESGNPVLENFSLKVKQGESIALVGPTGAGKSTIISLLCRFYEPTRGVIRLGGRDYSELSPRAFQSRLGVVLQTPHLFSGTIRENIRYGRLAATDQEVEEAAKRACAHEFIRTLEKGYETEVGERGVLLSVGQKQLISLTRAILVRPELFIMDEATSSVDSLTETLIQKGLEQLLGECTSFIIAHRLSTIRRADRILFIESGCLAEMGTHAELIQARGRYYQLYTEQFRHELKQKYDLLAVPEVPRLRAV